MATATTAFEKMELKESSEIRREISEIKEINRLHEESVDRARDLSMTLVDYVKKELASADRKFQYIRVSGMDAGCASPLWDPKITLSCGTTHYVGNGRFVVTRSNYSSIYSYDILDKEPDFDGSKLLSLCEQLSERLGVPVKFNEAGIIDTLDREPKNYRELKVYHKTGSIVAHGKIEYLGWDCKDEWAVVDDTDGRHFYCGSTGHGGGYNYHIRPGEDYSDVREFLSREDVFVCESVFTYFPEG